MKKALCVCRMLVDVHAAGLTQSVQEFILCCTHQSPNNICPAIIEKHRDIRHDMCQRIDL